MKTTHVRFITLFSAIFLSVISSCADFSSSKTTGEVSISIDPRSIAPVFNEDSKSSWKTDDKVELKIALFGDYKETKTISFTKEETELDNPPAKTVTFSDIPVDSSVSAKAVIYGSEVDSAKVASIGYYGESAKPVIISEEGENTIDLKMKLIMGGDSDSDSEVFGTSKDVKGLFFLEAFANGNYFIGYAKDFEESKISENIGEMDSKFLDDISAYVVSFGTYKITKGTKDSPEELQITELVYTEAGKLDYKFVEKPASVTVPVKEGKFSVKGNNGVTIDFEMGGDVPEEDDEEEPEEEIPHERYPLNVSISGFPAEAAFTESTSKLTLCMVQEGTDEANIIKEFIDADAETLSDETALKIFDLEIGDMDSGVTNIGSWGSDWNPPNISEGSTSIETDVGSYAFRKNYQNKKAYLFATVSLDDGSYYLALPDDFTEFNPEENKVSLTLKKWKVPYEMIIFLQKHDASGYEISETYSKKIALSNLAEADDMIGSAFNEVESKIAEAGEYRFNSTESGKKDWGQTFSISYYFDIKAASGSVSVDEVNIVVGDSDGELTGKAGEQSSFNLLAKKSSGEEIYDAEWSATLRNANGVDTASSWSAGTFLSFDGPNLIVRDLPEGSYFLTIEAEVDGNSYSRTYTLVVTE